MKKILINGITLDHTNLIPLTQKIKYWQTKKVFIYFLGNERLKRKVDKLLSNTNGVNFILTKTTPELKGKANFILQSLRRNFLAIFYLKKINKKFDIIYSISSVLDLIIFPFLLKIIDKNVKWATVFDNTVPFNEAGNRFIKLLAWIFYQLSLPMLKKADLIFTISEDLKKELIKKNFKKSRIILSTNGIESELIKNAKPKENFKTDALFIGRIEESKGIYDLLKTVKIVKKYIPNFKLSLMGDGTEKIKLDFKKRMKEFGLENNITFLGYKVGQEKFDIIKSSKIFLFLSHRESFGISLLEAVASGIPAISYNLKELKNIYKNNEVFMFKKGDYELIAKKIVIIFKNKNFTNKNGSLLIKKYSWKKIAKMEHNFF